MNCLLLQQKQKKNRYTFAFIPVIHFFYNFNEVSHFGRNFVTFFLYNFRCIHSFSAKSFPFLSFSCSARHQKRECLRVIFVFNKKKKENVIVTTNMFFVAGCNLLPSGSLYKDSTELRPVKRLVAALNSSYQKMIV